MIWLVCVVFCVGSTHFFQNLHTWKKTQVSVQYMHDSTEQSLLLCPSNAFTQLDLNTSEQMSINTSWPHSLHPRSFDTYPDTQKSRASVWPLWCCWGLKRWHMNLCLSRSPSIECVLVSDARNLNPPTERNRLRLLPLFRPAHFHISPLDSFGW